MTDNAVKKSLLIIKDMDDAFFNNMAKYNPYASQKLETIKRIKRLLTHKSESRPDIRTKPVDDGETKSISDGTLDK